MSLSRAFKHVGQREEFASRLHNSQTGKQQIKCYPQKIAVVRRKAPLNDLAYALLILWHMSIFRLNINAVVR